MRQVAEPIAANALGSQWLMRLVQDMTETMRDADGAGLAAPQVFESVQLCMLEVTQNPRYPEFPPIPFQVLINPRLTPLVNNYEVLVGADAITMYEGCLSVPGIHGRVCRPRRVRVQALALNGDEIDVIWSGVPAAIIQHEVDHLRGVLFVDRAAPKSLSFDREYQRHVPQAERCIDGV